jgi:hypothetical protein
MQADDRAELEHFKGLGYLEESGELRRMGNVDTCECKPANKAQPPQGTLGGARTQRRRVVGQC